MKKTIALLILGVVALTTTGYAQETTTTTYTQRTTTNAGDTLAVYTTPAPVVVKDWQTRFYFGLKAGANYSNVYDSEGENFKADSKFGFVGGLFIAIPLGRFLGLQPEVLFSQRGFHGTGTLLGNNYKVTRTSNFIDVPLLLAIKAGRGLTFVAGPQFSYLIKQKDEFTTGTENIEQEQVFKADNIRKNTMCFLGGVDFNFNNVVLGTRVGWDVRDNKGDGTSETPRYKNAWVQATLGIRF
jgi:hypothetical protein